MNNSDRNAIIKQHIGAFLFRYWCIGAIYFFIGMGLPIWENDPISGIFVLTLVIGVLDAWFIDWVIREYTDKLRPKGKYDYTRLLRSILFSSAVMAIVILIYYGLYRLMDFRVEAFGFALFFTTIYLLLKYALNFIGRKIWKK